MITVKSLCHSCKNFDIWDNECRAHQNIRLVGLYVPEVVAECENYEEDTDETDN